MRIGVIVTTTIDILRRMLSGARPIDTTMLVIELLILAIIAGQAALHTYRYFKVRHRLKRVHKFIFQGHALQDNADKVPDVKWIEQVNDWIVATSRYLQKCSSRALESFLHDDNKPNLGNHRMSHESHGPCEELQERLDNLRAIMETPDIYL
jgi:hypothetical protein